MVNFHHDWLIDMMIIIIVMMLKIMMIMTVIMMFIANSNDHHACDQCDYVSSDCAGVFPWYFDSDPMIKAIFLFT